MFLLLYPLLGAGVGPALKTISKKKMRCKNKQVFLNYHQHAKHPAMVELLWWLEGRVELILTSAYRKRPIHAKDSGIHAIIPIRAVDIRSWIFKNPHKIEKSINDIWIYDPKRPNLKCCVLHDSGHGVHCHIQVHNNTVRRYLKEGFNDV
ncbi:MAG: hypothetical protein BBJ57_07375 [Desulfobacterales bacterium PC51MH44]|nr:MAG: hypothetical protein BBJ57_07375 [Desulfobacterales bacterium PC51MH44]